MAYVGARWAKGPGLVGDRLSTRQHHGTHPESPSPFQKRSENSEGGSPASSLQPFEAAATRGRGPRAAPRARVADARSSLIIAVGTAAIVALLGAAEGVPASPSFAFAARPSTSGTALAGSRSVALPRATGGTLCFAGGLVAQPGLVGRRAIAASSRPSRLGGLNVRPFARRFRRQEVVVMIGLRPRANQVDYFAVLGLKRGATLDEIKAAYKSLALKNHPDVSKEPDAASKFAQIYEAYSTLSENEKNNQYRARMESMPRGPVRNTKHYRLGEVVTHKRDKYIAVVVGIDEVCGASEEWIEAQNIDRLQKGRNQRFYHLLPDLPNGGETLDDAAEVLCDCPAFLTMMMDEDEWPTLQTAYVPEDLLVTFMHTNHEGREGPVHNPLVKRYFMQYSRGRYAHDGHSLEAMKFFPVAEAITYCMLYGQTMSGPEDAEGGGRGGQEGSTGS